MNTSSFAAAAMIAIAAMAVPVAAWSAGEDSVPPPQGMTDGPEGGHMRHWGRALAGDVSPQQACLDHVARRAGFVAYMGAKLNLTAEQKPLWDRVLMATQSAQDNQRQACAALPASAADRGKETVIDHMNHHQQMLQAQLQALQQTQPAIQALYQSLSPEQKAVLDHPFRRG